MIVTVIALPGEKAKTQFTVRKSAMASSNTLTSITKELEGLLQSATDEALQKAAAFL